MKLIYKDDPFFHICLENVFSVEELKIIFQEISELQKNFKDPNFTGSATDGLEVLKKNTGIFLEEYENYEKLKIVGFVDDCIKKISINNKWKNKTFKRIFRFLMWGSELINCYKKDDYYKPHIDNGIFTLIFFLWENSSNFEGGDLFFPEYDYLHKCNNNTGILFFSKEFHGVTPIITNNDILKRYSIVCFSTDGDKGKQKTKRIIDNFNFTGILYQ